jgi:ribosomal protein S12 methylthiotransferase accessory factor
VTLWFRLDARAQAASAVDLATVDDPACRGTIDRVRAAGLDLVAWDATSDLGVPAFLCLLLDAREPEVGHGGLGAGCHPAREVALLRALTEAVQVRMTYISGARDDIAAGEYSSGTRAERLATARRLAAHRAATGLEFRELPTRAHPDFGADLAWLLERLGAAGLDEPVVVDLSRPEIGVAVVRVVAPGLEGPDDHPGYAPGRRARALDAAAGRA